MSALRAEPVQQSAELRVHERDLAVVRTAGEACRPGVRRLVRRVRVVVVDPREEGPAPLVEPAQDGVGRSRGVRARRTGRVGHRVRGGSGRRTRRSRALTRSAARAGTPTRTRPCGSRRRGRTRPWTGRPRAVRSRRCRARRAVRARGRSGSRRERALSAARERWPCRSARPGRRARRGRASPRSPGRSSRARSARSVSIVTRRTLGPGARDARAADGDRAGRHAEVSASATKAAASDPTARPGPAAAAGPGGGDTVSAPRQPRA